MVSPITDPGGRNRTRKRKSWTIVVVWSPQLRKKGRGPLESLRDARLRPTYWFSLRVRHSKINHCLLLLLVLLYWCNFASSTVAWYRPLGPTQCTIRFQFSTTNSLTFNELKKNGCLLDINTTHIILTCHLNEDC